jgi:long-chain acyl-CoA synthetase
MQVTRLFDIADLQLAEFPMDVCMASLEEGTLRSYSSADFVRTADALALGLMDLGIGPGDKVALASGNRCEWALVDQAVLRIGAIVIPIYPTTSADDYAYILEHSTTKVFFVSNSDVLAKGQEAKAKVPGLQHLFSFDSIAGTRHWKELLGIGEERRSQLEAYKKAVKPDDLATIIYTSGTTGPAQGRDAQRTTTSSATCRPAHLAAGGRGSRAISFLPLCHIYERMLMYLYQRARACPHRFQRDAGRPRRAHPRSQAACVHRRAALAGEDLRCHPGQGRSAHRRQAQTLLLGPATWANATT